MMIPMMPTRASTGKTSKLRRRRRRGTSSGAAGGAGVALADGVRVASAGGAGLASAGGETGAASRLADYKLLLDTRPQVVAHLAVNGKLLVLGALSLAGVGERPVQAALAAGEDGAGGIGLVAHGDHVVEALGKVAGQSLGRL